MKSRSTTSTSSLLRPRHSEFRTPPSCCSSNSAFRNPSSAIQNAFTLLELLVVMAIIGVLMALVIPALTSRKTADDITRAALEIRATLESARTFAVGNNTYAWVGFFEESSSSPLTAGTGRIVISVAASKDGTRVYSDTVTNPPPLNPALLLQIGKLIKLENVHLERLTDTAVTRSEIPVDQYHVGHADFAKRQQFDGSLIPNATTFPYPLTGVTQYTFTKIVQFNPEGDATKIVDTPTREIEVGLRPTHGVAIDTNAKNLVALQVAGITGQTKMYRP